MIKHSVISLTVNFDHRGPFIAVHFYIENSKEPYSDGEERANSAFFVYYLYITLATGLALFLYFFFNFLITARYGSNSFVVTPSNLQGEARLKRAATKKLNKMITNAHSLHDGLEATKDCGVSTRALRSVEQATSGSVGSLSAADKTLLNFVLKGQTVEQVGGFQWTWKMIFSGALFDTEGIWLPTRLLVFQGGQVLGFGVVSMVIWIGSRGVADLAAEAQKTLPDDLPSWARK